MSRIVFDAVVELRRALARAAAATFTGQITAKQASVLLELRSSEPVSQIALARATASDAAYLVRLLDVLEKRGLVSRERSEADRRQMSVSLTDVGRSALAPLDVSMQHLAAAAEAGLTAKERRDFVALASKVTGSLTLSSGPGAGAGTAHE